MKYFSSALLSLALISGTAAAGPTIDFTGISAGAQVLDYYNGGTDSLGESGPNYGVRFNGGIVQYNQFGAYLSGGGSMTFNASLVPTGGLVGFLANIYGIDGSYTNTNGGPDNFGDHVYVAGTGNPLCNGMTEVQCAALGYNVISKDSLFGYTVGNLGGMTQIGFNVNALDNIEFNASGRPADRIARIGAEVPEPGTIFLLLAGLLYLPLMRRLRS